MKTKDIEGREWEYGECLSCAIVSNQVKSVGGVIYETKNFLVMQDIGRPIDGFIVICSRRHVITYDELTQEERVEFSELLHKVESTLKRMGVCDYFNIYLAEYKEGHFHVQILPRYKWMEDERGTIIGNLNRGFKYAKENLNTKENIDKIKKTIARLKKELKK